MLMNVIRKRVLSSKIYQSSNKLSKTTSNESENETKEALKTLTELFPRHVFENRLPPIVLKHQLYSLVKNKTQCDKELGSMRDRDEIRLFKMGNEVDEFYVTFTDDYCSQILKLKSSVADHFVDSVVKKCSDVSYTREQLNDLCIQEEDVKELINSGLLTVRDVGSWWLAIPGAGEFVKTFVKGRKHVLLMVRRSKYGEILRRELSQRKLHKDAKLGVEYHIHDVIGAELVKCIETTSGTLIRINDS